MREVNFEQQAAPMILTRVQKIVVCEEPAPFPPGRVRDPREPPEVRWPAWIVLTFFCLVLFFYRIGTGDLWRAENLRALVAREILRSGDWIVPRLYGEPYLTKPPVMYAAIALASWPFGEVRPWTARLPSALAAAATVWMFYWYFARVLGRHGGLLAALVLPAAPMWLDKAGAAEIDMLQVAWVTGAVLCFLRALECAEEGGAGGAPGRRWWLLALLCVAGGVLTKWTAPVFFYATALALLVGGQGVVLFQVTEGGLGPAELVRRNRRALTARVDAGLTRRQSKCGGNRRRGQRTSRSSAVRSRSTTGTNLPSLYSRPSRISGLVKALWD